MNLDRLKIALIEGFTNPYAQVPLALPPYWFHVGVLVVGILIGSGLFQGGL